MSGNSQSMDPLACFNLHDVRAIVGETFNASTYTLLGKGFSRWLREHSPGVQEPLWVAVGYDARTHSPALADALVQSLRAEGISVVQLGFCPTPAVYFAQQASQSHASVPAVRATLTVTASHNPGVYNGLKFTFQPFIFSEKNLLEVKAHCADVLREADQTQPAKEQGLLLQWDVLSEYRQYLINAFKPAQKRWKVVVDAGNATGGLVAPDVFRAVGCEVIELFTEPDGTFPNHHPDPCQHKNLQDLIRTVREQKADFGVAFDGDSDRLGVVDAAGMIVSGDILVLLFAEAILENGGPWERTPVVISEVKCTQKLFDRVAELGGEPVMSATGHLFIKRLMKERQAVLGGELSGHFFFQDRYFGYDDAFYAALRFMELLDQKYAKDPSISSDQLTRHLPKTILSEEKRVPCPKPEMAGAIQRLKETLPKVMFEKGLAVQDRITLDGIRAVIDGGFLLIRPSNTEPCLTVRYEAPDERIAQTLEAALSEALALSLPLEQALT